MRWLADYDGWHGSDGVEPVAGSFNGVVVGEVVVECAQHPNADKLRVTKVNVGGGTPVGYRLRRAKLSSGAESSGETPLALFCAAFPKLKRQNFAWRAV